MVELVAAKLPRLSEGPGFDGAIHGHSQHRLARRIGSVEGGQRASRLGGEKKLPPQWCRGGEIALHPAEHRLSHHLSRHARRIGGMCRPDMRQAIGHIPPIKFHLPLPEEAPGIGRRAPRCFDAFLEALRLVKHIERFDSLRHHLPSIGQQVSRHGAPPGSRPSGNRAPAQIDFDHLGSIQRQEQPLGGENAASARPGTCQIERLVPLAAAVFEAEALDTRASHHQHASLPHSGDRERFLARHLPDHGPGTQIEAVQFI